MKIALPIYIGGHGGASRQVTKLANTLCDKGHDVYMIALHLFAPVFKIDERVKIIDITDKKLDGKITILSRYLALRRVLKDIKPDITIHYNFQSVYLTVFSLLSKKAMGKVIMAERGDPSDAEYSGMLGLVRSVAIRFVDGFVFQTNGAKNYFNSRVQQRSVVIPNSVTIPNELQQEVSERKTVVLSAGRLHPQKNHRLLIRSYAKIADRYPQYTLEIYGDGDMKSDLDSLVHELKMEGRIHINYSVKNIFEKIREATLFVLSSDFEGMPNALMEAMALGTPAISTDCSPGGARDLITDGVNGWIVPVRNEEALAEKMDYVLSHPKEAERVANNARNIVNTHSDDAVFSVWEKFIYDVVNRDK